MFIYGRFLQYKSVINHYLHSVLLQQDMGLELFDRDFNMRLNSSAAENTQSHRFETLRDLVVIRENNIVTRHSDHIVPRASIH